jgi:peroxin-11B
MPTNSLIYHPTVTHYLKFVATTVGRDKLLRTLQYFSRFYAWYLYRTNALPSTISPYTTIKTKFGETRKFLRIGKFVEHFKAAAVAADSKGLDGVVKYCAVGRQLGYAGYLSLDAVTVLGVLGLKNFTKEGKERVQREAYRFWMFGLLFSTMSSVYSLYNLRLQQQRIDKKEGEGVVAAKRIEK